MWGFKKLDYITFWCPLKNGGKKPLIFFLILNSENDATIWHITQVACTWPFRTSVCMQSLCLEASVLTWLKSRTLGLLSSLISVDSQLKQHGRESPPIHLAVPHLSFTQCLVYSTHSLGARNPVMNDKARPQISL